MKKEICKTETKWVTSYLVEMYQLILENGTYSLICAEKNMKTGQESQETVEFITMDEQIANKVFEIITKNKVCEGTLKDVIQDLMC